MKKLAAVQRWTPAISEVDPPGTPTPNILGRSIWSDWPERRVADVCQIRQNQGNPEPGPFIPLPEEAISPPPLAAFTVVGGRGSHLGYDDHGGSLKALIVSGSVGLMKNEDIDTISYFQVDNSLIHCLGPTFLGYHIPGEPQMSSKTIPIHAIACALWLQTYLYLETSPLEEFTPIKNATGEDSPAFSYAAQIAYARNWVRSSGIDAGRPEFEVSPTFATLPSEFSECWYRRRKRLAGSNSYWRASYSQCLTRRTCAPS